MALFNPSWLWKKFFQCATCELKKERFSINNVAIYKIFNRQWWLGIQKSCYLGLNQLKAFWIKNVLKISWDNQTVIHQHRLFKVKWINSCYNYPTSHWIWAIRGTQSNWSFQFDEPIFWRVIIDQLQLSAWLMSFLIRYDVTQIINFFVEVFIVCPLNHFWLHWRMTV